MAPQRPGEHIRPSHHKRINKEIHNDMVMFEEFLHEMVPEWERSIPFLVRREIFSESIQLYADSAGAWDCGFSCVFGNCWAYG